LRERQEDIEPLLHHFVTEFSVKMNKPYLKVDRNVVGMLKNYKFPGNVRELKNMTERAVILLKGNLMTAQDFPLKTAATSPGGPDSEMLTIQEQEIRLLRQALREHSYNQKAAAEALGITRDAFIRKMKKHNIRIKKED
jgi:DNA-binding NtrC family response regulator